MPQWTIMRYLDLTLPTPADNLALDEALLEEAEAAGQPVETLRFWGPTQTMVVIGRSSKLEGEVQLDACRRSNVPVLRRISGGAAIVAGPGCLMYAVVLSRRRNHAMDSTEQIHRRVLSTMAAALEPLVPGVTCRGTSDLAVGQRKFSGNSVRCRRDHVLYHGTLLYDFPLEQIGRFLATPPRQPEYREGRAHQDFVTNLPLSAAAIRAALVTAWDATELCDRWPETLTQRLAAEKYSRPAWNVSR